MVKNKKKSLLTNKKSYIIDTVINILSNHLTQHKHSTRIEIWCFLHFLRYVNKQKIHSI